MNSAETIPPPPGRHRPTWLARLLAELLYPTGTRPEDFLSPSGEAALCATDSVSWRVFANPLSVFIGGVAAVVLELAEPRVRSGVWEHTSFRRAPLERMRRTGYAAMMTVYGPRGRTERMITAVNERHRAIAGQADDGRAYRASDEVLLEWVQVTASFGFLEARRAWVQPVSATDADRYYAEGQAAARLYGVASPPGSEADADAVLQRMRPQLEASAVVLEFLRIVRTMPALPWFARPLQGWLVKAAVQCLPAWTRTQLGLAGREWRLAGWQAALLRRAGRAADRLEIATHPVVQARRRMRRDGATTQGA